MNAAKARQTTQKSRTFEKLKQPLEELFQIIQDAAEHGSSHTSIPRSDAFLNLSNELIHDLLKHLKTLGYHTRYERLPDPNTTPTGELDHTLNIHTIIISWH
ncbi:hypothetical protein ACFPK9_01070 [Rubritalea spongiae]|uniref:Uncharacterized protein n=1 Tax=Rubritalea spongiae TaxID=430797 RepID=A0ABW5DZI0_9BACT